MDRKKFRFIVDEKLAIVYNKIAVEFGGEYLQFTATTSYRFNEKITETLRDRKPQPIWLEVDFF